MQTTITPTDVTARNITTPWGKAQTAIEYADGIIFYSTASHGGFWLSDERVEQFYKVLPLFRTFVDLPQWFEEDCDWCAVVLRFSNLFPVEMCESAGDMVDAMQNRTKWQYVRYLLG